MNESVQSFSIEIQQCILKDFKNKTEQSFVTAIITPLMNNEDKITEFRKNSTFKLLFTLS